MTTLMIFYGKFLAASLLLLAFYMGVLRVRVSYAQARLYLLLLPMVSLLMSCPRLEVWRPAPTVVEVEAEPSGPLAAGGSTSVLQAAETVVKAQLDGAGYDVYVVWGIGCVSAVLLLIAIYNIIKMWRLRTRLHSVPLTGGCRVVRLQSVDAPFSFVDTVFLPTDMTPRAEDYILRHEAAHVLRRHYLDVWTIELLTRLLWFNPVLWVSRNELRNVHEFEADRDVVGGGIDLQAYQSLLLEYSMQGCAPVTNGFTQSFVRRRFSEMRKPAWGRMGRWGRVVSGLCLLLLFCSFTLTVGDPEVIMKQKIQVSDALPLRPTPQGAQPEAGQPADPTEVTPPADPTDEAAPAESREPAALTVDRMPQADADGRPVFTDLPANTSKRISYKGFYLRRLKDATHLVCVATPEDDDELFHLGSPANTYIVDMEHGIHYRARGSLPAGTWDTDFHARGMKGRTFALTIVFPPLDVSTDRVRIYGVGGWNLRGQEFRVEDIEEP